MNNVIPLQIVESNLHDDILAELGSKKARGIEIDVYDYISLIDFDNNCTRIRDWFIKEHLITKREWNRAVEVQKVKEELGGDPKTPAIFLDLFCKKNNIKVDYKKAITQDVPIFHEGYDLELELARIKHDKEIARLDQISLLTEQQRLFEDIRRCRIVNLTTEDLARTLRIKAKELDLRFSASDIDDVIQAWLQHEQANRRTEIFTQIMYGNHRMPIAAAKDSLLNNVNTAFDSQDISTEMQCAVLETFIQQVKRKLQNLPITNHLMPIIVGPQGIGKSTWVERFLGPLAELTTNTDFRQLTDDRNISLFSDNFVAVCDEMARINRIEIDVLKHVISASHLTRRVMRSNNVVTIRQNLTFIGTSNKEIDQLIRDETGMRRFVSLHFNKHPDFSLINATDYHAIWQSVDELGPDPLDKFRDRLKTVQESNRIMNPCEEWIRSLPTGFGNGEFSHSATLYLTYREWENNHYTNKRSDHDDWSKEIRRLVLNIDGFPVEIKTTGKGYMYKILSTKKE